MAYFGKVFTLDKNENFEAFINSFETPDCTPAVVTVFLQHQLLLNRALNNYIDIMIECGSINQDNGLPKDKADSYLNFKSTQKIEKDGDGYVITTISGHGTTVMKFKPGVEFEQNLTPEIVTKNIINVEGDKFTQLQKGADGKSITYVREFSPVKLVVTMTSSIWDGVAKRFYTA